MRTFRHTWGPGSWPPGPGGARGYWPLRPAALIVIALCTLSFGLLGITLAGRLNQPAPAPSPSHQLAVEDPYRSGGQAVDWFRGNLQAASLRGVGRDLPRALRDFYAGQGYRYEEYEPAYRAGYGYASNPQYQGRRWEEVEPEIQRDWNARSSIAVAGSPRLFRPASRPTR